MCPSHTLLARQAVECFPRSICCQDDKALEGEDYGGDDNDTYYIMIRKPEELMPPSCLFNNLDRSEADRYVVVGVAVRVTGRIGCRLESLFVVGV